MLLTMCVDVNIFRRLIYVALLISKVGHIIKFSFTKTIVFVNHHSIVYQANSIVFSLVYFLLNYVWFYFQRLCVYRLCILQSLHLNIVNLIMIYFTSRNLYLKSPYFIFWKFNYVLVLLAGTLLAQLV